MPYVVFIYAAPNDAITFRGWLEERPLLRDMLTRTLPPREATRFISDTLQVDVFSFWDDIGEVALHVLQRIQTAFDLLPGMLRSQVGVGNTIEEAIQDVLQRDRYQRGPRPMRSQTEASDQMETAFDAHQRGHMSTRSLTEGTSENLNAEAVRRILSSYINSQQGRTELARRMIEPLRQRSMGWATGALPIQQMPEGGHPTFGRIEQGDGEVIQRPDEDPSFSATIIHTGIFDSDVPDHLRDSIAVGQHNPGLGGTVLAVHREGPTLRARIRTHWPSEDSQTQTTLEQQVEEIRRIREAMEPTEDALATIARATEEHMGIHTGHPLGMQLPLPSRFPEWCTMGAWIRHKELDVYGQVIDSHETAHGLCAVLELWEHSPTGSDGFLGDGTPKTPEGNHLVSAADVIGRWEPWNEDRLPKTFWELLDENTD